MEYEKKSNSISPSNHVLFCLLYKQIPNKKKSTLFTFQKENALPFIHGANSRVRGVPAADW